MVSNDEIKRKLKQKREGLKSDEKLEKTDTLKPVPEHKDPNVCPQCDQTNTTTARFCVGCGTELITEFPENSQEIAEIQPEESVGKPAPPIVEIPPQTTTETSYKEPSEESSTTTKMPDFSSKPEAEQCETITDLESSCTQCGLKNDSDADFCIECGTQINLEVEKKTAPEIITTPAITLKPKTMPIDNIPKSRKKCLQCGTENGKESDFCIECGASMKSYSPNSEPEVRAKKNKTGGFFGPEKKGIEKGVNGGLAMIGISVLWFFGGLIFLDRIFFYPFILFAIGIYALIKGLATS
jgi:membrane protease subunit (stomatin/prohibitin family)